MFPLAELESEAASWQLVWRMLSCIPVPSWGYSAEWREQGTPGRSGSSSPPLLLELPLCSGQIVICGDPQAKDTKALLQCVHSIYIPNKVRVCEPCPSLPTLLPGGPPAPLQLSTIPSSGGPRRGKPLWALPVSQ